MFGIVEIGSGNVLGLECSGKLTEADLKAMQRWLDPANPERLSQERKPEV